MNDHRLIGVLGPPEIVAARLIQHNRPEAAIESRVTMRENSFLVIRYALLPLSARSGLLLHKRDSMSDSLDKKKGKFIGVGICFGVAIGCGIGVAIGNLALGIGPGIAIGVVIGALMSKSRR